MMTTTARGGAKPAAPAVEQAVPVRRNPHRAARPGAQQVGSEGELQGAPVKKRRTIEVGADSDMEDGGCGRGDDGESS